MNYKFKIILLAILINTLIFFFLPFIKYLQDQKLSQIFNNTKENLSIKQFKIEPPKSKKKKLKVQKNRHLEKDLLVNERFKLDLNVNVGSGVKINYRDTKNIIYREGDVDVLPEKISGNNPEIPSLFANSSLNGKVEILVVIDENGRVVNISSLLEEPTGYQLKNSVIRSVWNWQFKPATLKNIPVKIQVIIPFVF